MNRKKFVKYLMGKGLPRNKANRFAYAINKGNIPYSCCKVDTVARLSGGSHYVTGVFSGAFASSLISKGYKEPQTGLTFEDVELLLEGYDKDEFTYTPRIKTPDKKRSDSSSWYHGIAIPELPIKWKQLLERSEHLERGNQDDNLETDMETQALPWML